jgi:hypothetical protein
MWADAVTAEATAASAVTAVTAVAVAVTALAHICLLQQPTFVYCSSPHLFTAEVTYRSNTLLFVIAISIIFSTQ